MKAVGRERGEGVLFLEIRYIGPKESMFIERERERERGGEVHVKYLLM